MKNSLVCFFFFLFLVGSVSLFANHKNSPKKAFVVGTTSGYAPYVSLNAKGEHEGFDIDFAGLVAERLDRKLVIQDLGSMPSLLVGLKKKKVDALIWAMSITKDRLNAMEMIYYQGKKEDKIPFVFWGEIPEGITSINDLEKKKNCTVCVEAGSYQDSILNNYSKLNVRFMDKIDDAIMEIRYGKSLATTIDSSLIKRVKMQYPKAKVLYLPLAEKEQSFGNGICVHKDNQDLSNQIKKIVADLEKEGKIAELEKKWGLDN